MTDTTLVDVADKALDRIANSTRLIVDAVQKVAPHAWELAVRQQRIDAMVGIVEAGVWIVAAIVVTIVLVRTRWWASLQTESGFAYGVTNAAALVAFGLAANCLGDNLMQCANPEFYAAKELLEMVKK